MDIVSIAVHPDDETLGCGGALLAHAASGDTIHWLLVTAAREPEFSPPYAALQAEQVEAVERAYPFLTVNWLKLPSTRLETVPFNELVTAIGRVIEALRPEVVFVPNRSDAHSDHRVAFDASMAVLKSFHMGSLGVRRVLACEVPSETDAAAPVFTNAFMPNVFVDVSTTLERKLDIMRLYESEVQPEPFPRALSSVRALARHRGATIGVEYAEAFMLLREIA